MPGHGDMMWDGWDGWVGEDEEWSEADQKLDHFLLVLAWCIAGPAVVGLIVLLAVTA